MLETIKGFLPAWAFALIAMVLCAGLAGFLAWETSGTVEAVVVAVLSSLLGVGVAGKAAIKGNDTPPAPPAVNP
jgi:CHASE2 domain-containing sensor protein